MDIRKAAINFIKLLSADEKSKIKQMLNHGIVVGADFARENNLDPMIFSSELKSIFEGN